MSTNQTQHLHLSQWEENDEILRADFNADNEKIDAGVQAAMNAAAAARQKADAISAAAYTPDNKPYVAGTYTGDGAETQNISLGFTPSAVLLFTCDGKTYVYYSTRGDYFGGLALRGEETTSCGLEITAGGFQVGYHANYHMQSNQSNTRFYYIAFR